MHIHILGICGTFMGGIAAIAKSLGHHVTGSDQNVYPPMSTQLEELGIELTQGYDVSQLEPAPDIVVIGNAMSRGNPCVEYVLDKGLPYTSGPEWLKHNLLQKSWVLAVAGTHGKTTTASMLAWILEYAGLKPGFLIGGIVQNFGLSARVGQTPFFVIEADEYDTAFFDKRSKFIHYLPRTLILNNLEFDHADIFEDLNAIKKQFHHLIRTLPQSGKVLWPKDDEALSDVIAKGLWSESETLGDDWDYQLLKADGSQFNVLLNTQLQGVVNWQAIGEHNVKNAMMAIAAARHVGIAIEHSIAALGEFISPKRRMELKADINNIKVYDDFAHHPTAIQTTLAGLRAKVGNDKIIAILEPRSNTMKMGVHQFTLLDSLRDADEVLLFEPENLSWSLKEQAEKAGMQCFDSTIAIIETVLESIEPNQHVLIMSNGGFNGLHQQFVDGLANKYSGE
ncbi:UDP-N-acetylmuramate:L-alanyl-gamma-D-glutamyl-meso-diaminopimelate ligase [Pseudoalteromonas sp. APC 3356]|jgi:UDP-N-acetylmuramate: L-alanyl-gamma-D-glutamyl-meso-diaminopimelate ligase|uniref:UDP-N-acetylmuramate--L-alanyl-gamma-D-glutamyl-meso-2,6-diaminoheptandioate ligase n=1 Tax=Pseudoalteromonas tetraodonis GFC TaxID=1315271 RepID=A0AA37W598_9GAMM|nr:MULTISPECIES: UDP-N-acetylmuramate:L-alanyl-gamma-D-glutamyl-meso-diaminopimelate ligase [Pseudoalteromonas]PHQ94943.1 MAG: UDP-N-acetylmuramate:L-alanyl-gamma-D-glutamyl-meso-diaminopimelate ligase [Pseudoalteromonas sp.]ADT67735.1 UDP-N-acetylmuramate:L-alanyl-gamma-D-glutamyl- meso-diaminopimelate ligase (murein peptide ligase) [Pseudoalteromonas sp. SM9913]ATD02398.1 UDP-N-acetylmuramate: L-alanyl-gamma-D-glutamyl-meso-diaminopimelate ligase [Pseudoalteromonas tetraodonis]MDN3436163.1 UD|tara:strand:- start:283 stop:1638 length:1356 start_codon:yes stop_codon:yes gene_type:complete